MKETDEILFERYVLEDDPEALRLLWERHNRGLTLFLYGYVGNMEDAEELMLETFAAATAGPTTFLGGSSFQTWLFAIGKRQALMRLRKMRRLPMEELTEQAADRKTPELELLKTERQQTLYRALERLSPDYRQVLYLLYLEGMRPKETARVMGKSLKQIYNLTDRGKRALRTVLEEMGFVYSDF